MDMVVTRCPGFLAGSAEDETPDETSLDGPTQKTGAELAAVVPLGGKETVRPVSNSAFVVAGVMIVLLGSWGKTSSLGRDDGPIIILRQLPAQESTSKKSFLE